MSEQTHQSELAQSIFRIARESALSTLEARAIRGGFTTVICMDCKAFIEDKPGVSVGNLSHGLCVRCEKDRAAEVIA